MTDEDFKIGDLVIDPRPDFSEYLGLIISEQFEDHSGRPVFKIKWVTVSGKTQVITGCKNMLKKV